MSAPDLPRRIQRQRTKGWRTSYRFFVDDRVYETQFAALTSMEIKHIADVPLSHRLAPEVVRPALVGGTSIFFNDTESIDLAGTPKRFYSVPQARP